MYFDFQTLDEAKNKFRELCKMLHPDTSGYDSQKDFITMFNEFRSFKPKSQTQEEAETIFNADEFYDLLKNFDGLVDVKINFVGSFIWLEDITPSSTYLQRELIKSIVLDGFNTVRFAPVRKLWYFSPSGYKQRSKSKRSFEGLKEQWGVKSYNTKHIIALQ